MNKFLTTAGAAIAALGLATAAHAVTFLDIQQYAPGSLLTAKWTQASGSNHGGTFTITTDVNWANLIDGTTGVALLTFTGSSTVAPYTAGPYKIQDTISGTFSIEGLDGSHGNDTGVNILSGSFSEILLSGLTGSKTAAVTADTGLSPPSSVTYASDVFTGLAGGGTDNAFTLSIGNLDNAIGLNGSGNLKTFSGVPTGSFSSAAAVVPEPAAWGLMLVGFGAVGAMIRRRKPVIAA